MTSIYETQITDEMIQSLLDRIIGAEVVGIASTYNVQAHSNALRLTVADVRTMLDRHDIAGDSPEDEILMAASIAAEPDGLPDAGIVTLHLSPE